MNKPSATLESLLDNDVFADRHVGPSTEDRQSMLKTIGYSSLDALADTAVPRGIRLKGPLELPRALSEAEALIRIKGVASKNKVLRSFIGTGYHTSVVPSVIQRNVLENPGWYTQYTPYQAEISQGRMEALLNFQTMIMDLTGMAIANASLLDEGTAAAEAMILCQSSNDKVTASKFFVASDCHPQTIAVVQTRAEPLGIEVVVGNPDVDLAKGEFFGVLLQYPGTDGSIRNYQTTINKAHAGGTFVIMAADILSLVLLKSPGELGADVAVGTSQRFGVPLFFGGPHAAYMATREEFKRKLPGRLIGVSKDQYGKPALRLTLQTREQHIRRDKATSNICTAQALLAIMASMYGVYHGPKGLKRIAKRVHGLTSILQNGLVQLGYAIDNATFFDTLCVSLSPSEADGLMRLSASQGMNLRRLDGRRVTVTIDEATTREELEKLFGVFAVLKGGKSVGLATTADLPLCAADYPLARTSEFLTHPVFNSHHSETEMMRYIKTLEGRDLSLTATMIPLGSCTMKLNAAAELYPVSWPEFSNIHPFAPSDQTLGYRQLFSELETWLGEITGFAKVSLQPNSGAQGEYAGLLVIRAYHRQRKDIHRNVCLIPKSAHGTNPASAAMAGMKIVIVECDETGNVDLVDLNAKAQAHAENLSCLMITYPSTHGVFEEQITEICQVIHKNGGLVYFDGANMNAQVGLCRPGEYGADVCHLNLHKTFCIPHGGGGPGVGPIGVNEKLAPFLPSHPLVSVNGATPIGPVSAAPWGSAGILAISWMYIQMMGDAGLKLASQSAILNANYIVKRLEPHYPILYRGNKGLVAHECILDTRGFKTKAGIEVDDIAKRLIDYGFHAPTVSFPVPGTLMVEPTESEPKRELDRFCDAMIAIKKEIDAVESGKSDKLNNALKNAPHTQDRIVMTEWPHPYTRESAAFPSPSSRERKFWPYVSRVDNAFGDRNLICSCPPIESYSE